MPDDTTAQDQSAVVVPFPARQPSAVEAVAALHRTHETLRSMSLDVVAQRIDWLASGVSLWPESLLTREHMLAQLRTLADGVRGLRAETASSFPPSPTTGGDAA